MTLNLPELQMADVVLKKDVSSTEFQYVKDSYVLIGQGARIIIGVKDSIVSEGRKLRKGR